MEQFAIKRPVRWIPMGAVLSVGLVLLLFMYHGSITTSIPFGTHNRYDNSRPQIPLRLLPLGDSTTKGGMFDGENSYRPALRNLLIGSGRTVDYIGNLTNGDHLDNKHEGHGGALISEIQAFIAEDEILLQHPNLVLLHAGTNDMNSVFGLAPQEPYEEGPARLESLVDAVLCECPDAVVVVSKIIRNTSWQTRVDAFNAAIDDIAVRRQAKGYKVWVADHSAIGGSDLISDGVHPSVLGYEKMALAWFQAIQEFPSDWVQPARAPSLEPAPECRARSRS